MAQPHYPTGAIFMPICGDDPDARTKVVALAKRIGFEALDVGPLCTARYLEPLAMAWIHMAVSQDMDVSLHSGSSSAVDASETGDSGLSLLSVLPSLLGET